MSKGNNKTPGNKNGERSQTCGWGWRVFHVRRVKVQRYPMRLSRSRDKNIVKTVNNFSDVTFKSIMWLFYQFECNAVNDKIEAKIA